MNIQFATCNVRDAIKYIKAVYPRHTLNETKFPKLIELISKDILRVQDPMMHGSRIAIIGGNNYKEDHSDAIKEATDQLMKHIEQVEADHD